MKILLSSQNLRRVAVIFLVLILSNAMFINFIGGESNLGTQTPGKDNIMKLSYTFTEPSINYEKGYDVITMEGLELINIPTEPMLPFRTTKILLPPNTELDGIDILTSEKLELPGSCNIKFGLEPVPLIPNPPVITTEPDSEIYSSSDPYPGELYEIVSVENFRGYNILLLNLYPVQYIPVSGTVSYYYEFVVSVGLKSSPGSLATSPAGNAPIFRGTANDEMALISKIDNPEIINTYNLWCANNPNMPGSQLAPTWEYLIVTDNALNNSAGTYTLQDLAAARTAQGLNTKIMTVENITGNPAFWGGTSLFNDTQAIIRNCIIYAYNNWQTEFVLLAGDADGGTGGDLIVPCRGFAAGSDSNIPSDLYYSALNGNWNSDNDANWGEVDEADLYSEVYVGRACVDSETELSNFVDKTFHYENTYDLYLRDVIMVGEFLWANPDTYGGDYKDEIKEGSSAHGYTTVGVPDVYTTSTLYDKDGSWGKSTLINIINNNVHIINHLGHSNINYNMKMGNSDAAGLVNDHPFFVYSQGCYPGSFDNRGTSGSYSSTDCIVEYFMGQPKGSFAFVGNSRYGYGSQGSTNGASQYFDREFFDALYGENLRELGKANHDSKEDNNGIFNSGWVYRWCYYQTNLFGDPSLKIRDPAPPEHELVVEDLVAPEYAVPGNMLDINARVNNTGRNNETNVLVNFTVDGMVTQDTTLGFLKKESSTRVNFSWTPAGGIYEVGIEVQPVAGESFPLNNKETKTVIAEHDIAVIEIELANYLITGQPVFVNGTVKNLAQIDAANIDVKLKIDSLEVNSTQLSTLNSQTTQRVSFGWTPISDGEYSVAIYAVPMAAESLTLNNELTKDTFAWPKPVKKVAVLDSGGTDSPPPSWNTLNSNWLSNGDTPIEIDYTTFDYEGITYTHLKQESPDVLVISCAIDATTGEFTDNEIAAIERYVKEGHGLIVTDASIYYTIPNNNKFAPLLGVKEDQEYGYHWYVPINLNVLNTSHPLFDQISNPYVPAFKGSCIPDNDNTWDTNDLAGGTYIALGNGGGDGAIIVHRGLVLFTHWPEYDSNTADIQLLYNAMNWSKYKIYTNDIQVSDITLITHIDGKASVGKTATVNGTIKNTGKVTETNIQVQFKVDGALQSTTGIPSLGCNNAQDVSFQWTPNIAGPYDIEIYAVPVTYETYSSDNVKNTTINAISLPNLWVTPLSFEVKLNINEEDTKTLTIGNSGLLPLKFNVIDHPKFIEDFGTTTLNSSNWPIVTGTPVINDHGAVEPSAPNSLNLDSSGDILTSKVIDLANVNDAYFQFYYERGGYGDSPELINELYLEYYSYTLDWVLLWSLQGTGISNDTFQYVKLKLPGTALHSEFKFRFSTLLDEPGKDDFFVDNIFVNCTTDEDWLEVNTKYGQVAPSGDLDVAFDIKTKNLDFGDYYDVLVVDNNDPLETPMVIPVNLKVRKELDHIHMSTGYWEGTADELPVFFAIGHDEYHNTVTFEKQWSITDPRGTVNNGIYNPGKVGTWKVYCNSSDGSASNFSVVKINPGILHHINIDPTNHAMTTDETVQYTAIGCDSDNNEFSVSPAWSVTGDGAMIGTDGLFTPTQTGTWVVKARYNDKTGQANVVVSIGILTEIKIVPGIYTMAVGDTSQFNATGFDAKGNSEPISPVWNISGGGTINGSSGLLTANTAGIWTIYASYNDLVATATVTILPGELTRITVNPVNCTLSCGMKKQFNAIGYDMNYNPVKIQPMWTVTGGGIIAQDGLFTAKEIGMWTVNANHSGIIGTATVIVVKGILDHIIIDPLEYTMQAGATKRFYVIGCDLEENHVDDDLPASWEVELSESDGEPAGSIDDSGIFTAVKVGTWTLTASYSGRIATATVNIKPGDLEHIVITPSDHVMEVGQTVSFSATGYDLYDNIVKIAPAWSVDGGGSVTGANSNAFFIAAQPGVWELYAQHTLEDSTVVSGSATVTVKPIEDRDGDSLPDEWELEHGLDPSDQNDAYEDNDNDYLNNLGEYLRGTDPTNPDSDSDGLPDGWEVENGLDPLDNNELNGKYGDPDGDGVCNIEEYNSRTDPNNPKSYPGEIESELKTDGFEYYLLVLVIAIIAAILVLGFLVTKQRSERASEADFEDGQEYISYDEDDYYKYEPELEPDAQEAEGPAVIAWDDEGEYYEVEEYDDEEYDEYESNDYDDEEDDDSEEIDWDY